MKIFPMPRFRQIALLTAVAFLTGAAVAQNTSSAPESSSAASFVSADQSFGGSMAAMGAASSHHSYSGRTDWNSRIAFEAGGGFSAPTSDSTPYITWGGNVTLGAGLHYNKYLSLLAEYQFMDNKLPGSLIAETGANGGNAHIWSFTLAPVVDLFPKKTNSIYLTGGGGFYRKLTSFTDPVATEYCDYYYCETGTTNAVVGHFSSNQGGVNIGAGYSHKIGGIDSHMKLFAEARYLHLFTPAVTTEPNGLSTTSVAAGTNLIPVTFGVRF
jgi:hypothetical protein